MWSRTRPRRALQSWLPRGRAPPDRSSRFARAATRLPHTEAYSRDDRNKPTAGVVVANAAVGSDEEAFAIPFARRAPRGREHPGGTGRVTYVRLLVYHPFPLTADPRPRSCAQDR
jgi:hypothetical protein